MNFPSLPCDFLDIHNPSKNNYTSIQDDMFLIPQCFPSLVKSLFFSLFTIWSDCRKEKGRKKRRLIRNLKARQPETWEGCRSALVLFLRPWKQPQNNQTNPTNLEAKKQRNQHNLIGQDRNLRHFWNHLLSLSHPVYLPSFLHKERWQRMDSSTIFEDPDHSFAVV